MPLLTLLSLFFFFNDTATTEIYTLSLHDALPIFAHHRVAAHDGRARINRHTVFDCRMPLLSTQCLAQLERRRDEADRSEEHTSELQSQSNLVCRLLLEKKKKTH